MKISSLIALGILTSGALLYGFNNPIGSAPDKENAQKGIEFFHGSWKEALEKSKEEGKPIFVDVYATWCGPCKMMSRLVFTQEDVGDYFNEHFINMKVDAEKGEGKAVARKYRVMAYPTMLFVDDNGEILNRVEGAIPGKSLISYGERAIREKHKR